MQLNKGMILDRKIKYFYYLPKPLWCTGTKCLMNLKYCHMLIPYYNVAQRCNKKKSTENFKDFSKLPLPMDFYGNAVHVILCPATYFFPFSLPSLSSSMLSSPITSQEKKRHDKLTYESHSILIPPSLKDLSLSHIVLVSPPELSNELAIPSFVLLPAASILTQSYRFLGLCSRLTICIHLTRITFMILDK